MKPIATSFILLMGLAACVGPFAASPGGGLMYQVPDIPELVYLTGDTTNIDIDAGPMGSLRMRGTGTATLAMSFERGAEGIQVTTTFQELDARMSQPMGGAQGQASDIEITTREILKMKKELYAIIAEHSGNSIEKVEKDGDRDYWMTADEAKEYGMIDEILVRTKEK